MESTIPASFWVGSSIAPPPPSPKITQVSLSLKSRIDVYLQETTPLIDLYKKQNILKTLNGTQSIEDVSNDMNKSFDEIN